MGRYYRMATARGLVPVGEAPRQPSRPVLDDESINQGEISEMATSDQAQGDQDEAGGDAGEEFASPDDDDFGSEVIVQEEIHVLGDSPKSESNTNEDSGDDEDDNEGGSSSSSSSLKSIKPARMFPGLPNRTLAGARPPPPPRPRERSKTPIDIPPSPPRRRSPSPFSSLLPIRFGWMLKGIKSHFEDLPLSDIKLCDAEVYSKKKIEVLCQYTFIQITPSLEKTGKRFPAIYVPGNTRTWRGIKVGSDLSDNELRTTAAQTVRDDHAARQPSFPFEPTFRALEQPRPSGLNFGEIDVVTTQDTLCQLFRFLSYAPGDAKGAPFRLDLASVRNTLFITPKSQPGRGHTDKGSRVKDAIPEWAADALVRLGSREPRLPYSGGHYRLVRYRIGNAVCAVRCRVDFVYEHRKMPARAHDDPLYGVQPETYTSQKGDDEEEEEEEEEEGVLTWKTTVKPDGLGPGRANAGVMAVRYAGVPEEKKLASKMPALWFGRVPFVVQAVVSPHMDVKDAKLVNARNYYRTWERKNQRVLRKLGGLLEQLRHIARGLGGNCVVICDPVDVCLLFFKPVVKKWPVPEEIAVKFWGSDLDPPEEWEDSVRTESSDVSDLTDLSRTPTPPSDYDPVSGKPKFPPPERRDHPEEAVRSWLARVDGSGFGSGVEFIEVDDASEEPGFAAGSSQVQDGLDDNVGNGMDLDGVMEDDEYGGDEADFEADFGFFTSNGRSMPAGRYQAQDSEDEGAAFQSGQVGQPMEVDDKSSFDEDSSGKLTGH